MSSTQHIDKILSLYRRLCQIPSLVSSRIFSKSKNVITIQSIWSQRNLERRMKQTFIQDFSFDNDLNPLIEGFPIDITSELLTAYSENGEYKAILKDVTVDGKSKQFIEIWDKQHLSKSYDLSAYDVHGEVYTDITFSAFHLSPCNTKLLYVAEKKLPKCEPFYKQKSKLKSKTDKSEDEEELTQGTEYIYKPDWGEQLVGKHRSVVVILNIREDTIVPICSIPDEYFPGQVIWSPNGSDIIGVAYSIGKRYLGLYACTNRESYIFSLEGTEFRKLTGKGIYCTAPRLSPDKKSLIWLEREVTPAHHHVHRLMYLDNDEKPSILIDLVKNHTVIDDNNKFYGLYGHNLPKRCWSDDSKYIFLTTPQRSNLKSYVINIETKVITEINNSDGSSLTVMDVHKDYVTFAKFSLTKPHQLVIAQFNPNASKIGNLHLLGCTNPLNILNEENIMYEHNEFVYNTDEPVKEFNFTYFGKRDGRDKCTPMIAIPHGGPHTSFSNMFHTDYALLALLGFSIVQINYRGSTGMGGDNVDYLLGKVGDVDVLDCLSAINSSVLKYPWIDPKKINIYGGSHGGFLGAHLSGQYPDKFKTVVLLNPVIDIATMFTATDIPEWCHAESGCFYLENCFNTGETANYSELVLQMLNHSPIIHVDKVKTPTFIALGSKDLRVPSSQGKLWYNRLIANNVEAKLFMYEDNHSLRKDEVEIDNVINTALWLVDHNDV